MIRLQRINGVIFQPDAYGISMNYRYYTVFESRYQQISVRPLLKRYFIFIGMLFFFYFVHSDASLG